MYLFRVDERFQNDGRSKAFHWYKKAIMSAVKVEELWVYPIKACQGIPIKTAKITPTG